jgi:hypothetical protein
LWAANPVVLAAVERREGAKDGYMPYDEGDHQ